MIRTINSCILAGLAALAVKWVPPIEGPQGIIDTRVLAWGFLSALALFYLIKRSAA